MRKTNQSGIAHLGLVLAVLVIASVAFAGYRVWQSKDTATPVTATVTGATIPAAIKTKADLTATGKVLDQTDNQLDGSLNDAALDSDINSML